MPKRRRRRSAKRKLTDAQLRQEARKALRQAERTLEAEVKEIKRYLKALGGYSSFNVPFSGKR
jgi:hypothetical protein